jgi:hypothetical protein
MIIEIMPFKTTHYTFLLELVPISSYLTWQYEHVLVELWQKRVTSTVLTRIVASTLLVMSTRSVVMVMLTKWKLQVESWQ